jgi:hypothetical protein
MKIPKPFLSLRHHRLDVEPELFGFCAGYDAGKWRHEQLIRSCMRWLPEFALRYEEYSTLDATDAVDKIGEAAAFVYQSKFFKLRGELGELLLHMCIRQQFNTYPAISKIFFKDSPNVTVKGFDCVHVRPDEQNGIELWIGEAKLFSDYRRAVRSVVGELKEHVERGYLRKEFAAITRKIAPGWPYADQLRQLLDKDKPLDETFGSICIPVLLTYNSDCINQHKAISKQFDTDFAAEIEGNHAVFSKHPLPKHLVVRLILLPVESRVDLVVEFDKRLKACQTATA